MILWTTTATAIGSAFVASTVEVVEAFTVLLAVASLRGWRPAVGGALAAVAALSLLVAIFGPLLDRAPLHWLQLAIGVLLLLFGLGWLRKAVLRAAGLMALHDETAIFEKEKGRLGASERRDRVAGHLAWLTAFKAVLLEGLEVVFIVLAVGAGHGLLIPASIGALCALVAVMVVGVMVHRPLSQVPENTMKFAVGVMLSSFGVFWTGEGLGISWPAGDAALPAFAAIFLLAGLVLVAAVRPRPVAARS